MKWRYSLLLVVMALMVSSGYGQYEQNVWQTNNGITVRQGYHIEWFRAGYQNPTNGDQIYTWSDCRKGDRDVYAQKFDINGNPLWGEEGKLISRAMARQEDSDMIYVGNGNWIFAWVDYRRTPHLPVAGDIYAQKVDANGDHLWGPQAVAICTTDGVQLSLRLVHDGSGGLIILWEDDRADLNDIYAHHVLSSGVVDPAWPTDGLIVIHGLDRQEKLSVDSDGQGGAIVAWEDQRSVSSSGKDIYAQRVSPSGTLEWDVGGLPICTLERDQSNPKLCPDGRGGAYIVWNDRRSDIAYGDLYFQRVDDRGNPYFDPDSGALLCEEVQEQTGCRIMYGGEANALFTWVDYRTDPGNTISDVYAQKIDSLGNFLWGSTGVLVCNAAETQDGARFTTDGAGGAIIAWEDQRDLGSPLESDIYAQRILANGTAAWTTNGVAICTENSWQHSVLLKPDLNGGAFLVWSDLRAGFTGLYIQHINSSGQIQMATNGDLFHSGIDNNVDNPMIVQATQANPSRFLTVWEERRYGSICLFVQVVGSDSTLYLQNNGDSLYTENTDGDMSESKLVTDFQQGGLLVWKDNRSTNQGFNQIFAQRLNSNGSPLWNPDGVHVYSIIEEQQFPFIAGDESGGAFVAWSGVVEDSLYIRIYAQHLDAGGNPTWSQPVQVSNDSLEDLCRGAVPDGEGGVIITWDGGLWGELDVFAQKLDANGNALWQAGGLVVASLEGNQTLPAVIPDGTGGAVFAWENKLSLMADRNIMAQRVDRSGNLVWPDTGLMVCDAEYTQHGIQLEMDSDGNTLILWQDYRDTVMTLDLYMQKITPSGELLFAHNGVAVAQVLGDQIDPRMVGDSEDGVYIVWQDGRSDTSKDDIYCSHITGNGVLAEPNGWLWQEDGNPVCDAIFWQFLPAISTDGDGGGMVAWRDSRASGKEQVFNLFMQRINDRTTSPVIEKSNPVPVKFSLEQNYPNPFNPATRIRYNLSRTGHVKLVIYDILGRQVRILQNQVMTSGSHQVIWDGKNSSGTYASSGIYFYRLHVNDDTKIRKMVLLK